MSAGDRSVRPSTCFVGGGSHLAAGWQWQEEKRTWRMGREGKMGGDREWTSVPNCSRRGDDCDTVMRENQYRYM